MKKFLALLLLLPLLLSGCASLFDKQYSSIEKYQAQADTAAEEQEEDTAASGSITNYTALKRAIASLVSEHAESAELQFQNYDGSISQDISTACWEVKSSTALGAFAVDYISYDLSRIVSYYQAEIYITYKRTAEQVAALESIGTLSALSGRIDEALRAGETYLVLEISVAAASADAVRQSVESVYYGDPLACPVLPSVEVGVYPESGVTRIMEITLDYGADGESLEALRQELALALEEMLAGTGPEEGGEASLSEQVYALCRYLAESCVLDETAGGTAWDALVGKTASSEGLAMALEAGCQALGADCRVVSGRIDGEDHVWNIVTLDGASYHVDVSGWADGEEAVFLVSDEALWSAGYWWDTSEYPVCPEGFGYFDPPEGEASAEQEAVAI